MDRENKPEYAAISTAEVATAATSAPTGAGHADNGASQETGRKDERTHWQ